MENERPQSELFPEVMIYFEHVRRGLSHPKVMSALWQLVERTGALSMDISQYDVMYGMSASEDISLVNPILVKDFETIAPMAFLGPHLERSLIHCRRVIAWFEAVAREMVRVAPLVHSPDCLADELYDGERCDESAECPWRFIEAYLGNAGATQDIEARNTRKIAHV